MEKIEEFEKWLRTVCFQKPIPEAYDLARDAWKMALTAQKDAVADVHCNDGVIFGGNKMTIDQAKNYLKRRYKKEYHTYIDTKLAGDFAVTIAEKQIKMELKQETRRKI